MSNIEPVKRLVKLLTKRDWKIKSIRGNIVTAYKTNYLAIILAVEGRGKVFVSKDRVRRLLEIRNSYRSKGYIADAIIAARIGRKWHFLLLTSVKNIRLERGVVSNWYP